MASIRTAYSAIRSFLRQTLLRDLTLTDQQRCFSSTASRYQDQSSEVADTEETEGEESSKGKDIYPQIDPDTSMRYMESEAYQTAYQNEPVWRYYRRNFKGQIPPETRKTCIRSNRITTGNPCPVCRDEYLVLYYKNVKLLNQFISPYTGEILPSKKTGICQRQFKKLKVEVEKAQDLGYIEVNVPFRKYNYNDYLNSNKGTES